MSPISISGVLWALALVNVCIAITQIISPKKLAVRYAYASVRASSALMGFVLLSVASVDGAKAAENHGQSSPSVQRTFRSALPIEGPAPSIAGATDWINSSPLSIESLKGKVVLIDFWTYSCINCIRTLPYLKAWSDKYRDMGLEIVGVHAPEFAFEKRIDNIKAAVERFKIEFPVAVDNNFSIWRAYENRYWPAFYLIDAQGRIRHHQFGEGSYEDMEAAIRDLLREAGTQPTQGNSLPSAATGAEVPADYRPSLSAETYLGYEQARNFASIGGVAPDTPKKYYWHRLDLNGWGLTGDWTVGAESAVLNHSFGEIAFRFNARDLHLVMGSGQHKKPVRFQVLIDGAPPGKDHGTDTDEHGVGTVTETRLYQLVRQSGVPTKRTFTIRFLDAGVNAYVFTFG
jgi:thiol-disulfide isomerase/thioredoxin